MKDKSKYAKYFCKSYTKLVKSRVLFISTYLFIYQFVDLLCRFKVGTRRC